MELTAHISFRPAYTNRKVLVMNTIRYLQTGYLLHLMCISSMILFCLFGKAFINQLNSSVGIGKLILSGYATSYFFSLIFFSQLDARSRFQNYKLVKDKFYEYGFDIRLLKPFMYSRCQRDAIHIAAKEFKFDRDWKELTRTSGFRWYHLLPTMIIRHPLILFTRSYWKKTLFVKAYYSKYFLW